MQLIDFWRNVDSSGGEGACWPWTRAINKSGYGSVWIHGQAMTASRLAYQLAKGHIPNHPSYHGLVVRHTCDNRKCCNPSHMILGTQGDNNADRDRRNRVKNRKRGSSNHHSSLNEQDVLHIRALRKSGLSLAKIALQVGCTKSAVAHICSGRCWGWLADTPLGEAALKREGLAA